MNGQLLGAFRHVASDFDRQRDGVRRDLTVSELRRLADAIEGGTARLSEMTIEFEEASYPGDLAACRLELRWRSTREGAA